MSRIPIMSRIPKAVKWCTVISAVVGAGVGAFFAFRNINKNEKLAEEQQKLAEEHAEEQHKIQTNNPIPSVTPEGTPNVAGAYGSTMKFIVENAMANDKITTEQYNLLNKGEYGLNIALVGVDEESSNLLLYSTCIKDNELVALTEFTLGRTSSGKSIDQTFQELTKGKDVIYTNDTDRILVETIRDGWSVIDSQIVNDELLLNFYKSKINTSGDASSAVFMSNFKENGEFYTAYSLEVSYDSDYGKYRVFENNISVAKKLVEGKQLYQEGIGKSELVNEEGKIELVNKEVPFGDTLITIKDYEQAAAYVAFAASQGGPEASHYEDDEGNPIFTYITDTREIETVELKYIVDNVAGSTFVYGK